MELIDKKCNLCGSDNKRGLLKKGLFNIVKCRDCGLIFVNPQPDKEFVKEFYDKYFSGNINTLANYAKDEFIRLAVARQRLKLIESKTRNKRGNILDIGCASGYFLKIAKDHGWRAYGVDISEEAVSAAKRKFSLNVYKGELFDAGFEDGYFDVVTIFSTLGRLLEPLATFKYIYRILKPGGFVAAVTAMADSRLWLFREKGLPHFYYFTPQTVRALINKSGLSLIESKTVLQRANPFQNEAVNAVKTKLPSFLVRKQNFIFAMKNH